MESVPLVVIHGSGSENKTGFNQQRCLHCENMRLSVLNLQKQLDDANSRIRDLSKSAFSIDTTVLNQC